MRRTMADKALLPKSKHKKSPYRNAQFSCEHSQKPLNQSSAQEISKRTFLHSIRRRDHAYNCCY